MITEAASRIRMNDLSASVLRSDCLSAIRADASQSGNSIPDSAGDMNEPAIPGKRTKRNVRPPVMPNAILTPFRSSFLATEPLKISRRARMPRRGMQNSAITRIIVTARNLLYPGK